MAEFKVGDKVRCIREGFGAVAGKVYTVSSVESWNKTTWLGMAEGLTGSNAIRYELVPEPKKRKVYIAGPMTGLPDYNFPAFNAAAAVLEAAGLEVFNPAVNGCGEDWTEYMKRDIPELLKCDAIVALPDAANSKGAQLELHIAYKLGIPVYYYTDVELVAGLLHG